MSVLKTTLLNISSVIITTVFKYVQLGRLLKIAIPTHNGIVNLKNCLTNNV